MIFDGGREHEILQQREYPSSQGAAKKNDPFGNENCGMIFCETIRCVFKGKKRLETISQTFIVQKRDWLLNLTAEGTIHHRNRQKNDGLLPMI